MGKGGMYMVLALGKLSGRVSITGLPPRRGLIITLNFYEVNGPDAPAPYGGDPPPDVSTDSQKIIEQVDLDQECQETLFEQEFDLSHRMGHFYVELSAILFRNRKGAVFAQVERFFFSRRLLEIAVEPVGDVTFPVAWPAKALEDLHEYGTISPRKKSWWKFW